MRDFTNKLSEAEIERLAILIEECAEVQQIACKILRHGYESYNPTIVQGKSNREELEIELGDLTFAITLLEKEGDTNVLSRISFMEQKAQKVQKYLHHNEIKP